MRIRFCWPPAPNTFDAYWKKLPTTGQESVSHYFSAFTTITTKLHSLLIGVLNNSVCLPDVRSPMMSDILELVYFNEVRVNAFDADEFIELAIRLRLRGFNDLNATAIKQSELNRKLSQNGKSPRAIKMNVGPITELSIDCEGGGEMQYKRSPNGKCVEEKLRAIRSDSNVIGATVAIAESDSGSENNFWRGTAILIFCRSLKDRQLKLTDANHWKTNALIPRKKGRSEKREIKITHLP